MDITFFCSELRGQVTLPNPGLNFFTHFAGLDEERVSFADGGRAEIHYLSIWISISLMEMLELKGDNEKGQHRKRARDTVEVM